MAAPRDTRRRPGRGQHLPPALYPNPNPCRCANQTEPGGNECHLGAALRTLYFNMEVAALRRPRTFAHRWRYDRDHYVGVSARPSTNSAPLKS